MTDSKHTIFSLMPDECFFQGIDEKGRLEFRTQISLNAPKSAFVSERYLAAVAMTEICRKYGKGKVFYSSMPGSFQPPTRQSINKRIQAAFSQVHGRFPELVYSPFVWGPTDRLVWDNMKPNDRLLTLNARASCLTAEDIVLPMDLTFALNDQDPVRLNGFGGVSGGCKAVLAIVPQAYLGWHSELRPILQSVRGPEESQIVDGWYTIEKASLEAFRIASDCGIAERLWAMYFEQHPRSLVHMRSIKDGVKKLYQAEADWSAARSMG